MNQNRKFAIYPGYNPFYDIFLKYPSVTILSIIWFISYIYENVFADYNLFVQILLSLVVCVPAAMVTYVFFFFFTMPFDWAIRRLLVGKAPLKKVKDMIFYQ